MTIETGRGLAYSTTSGARSEIATEKLVHEFGVKELKNRGEYWRSAHLEDDAECELDEEYRKLTEPKQ